MQTLEQVNKEWNEAATKMYAQAGPEEGGPQAQEAPGAEQQGTDSGEKQDDAQDADFEVVDEKDDKK